MCAMSARELFTPSEAAAFVGVKPAAIYKAVSRGTIPAQYPTPGRIRIARSVLEDYKHTHLQAEKRKELRSVSRLSVDEIRSQILQLAPNERRELVLDLVRQGYVDVSDYTRAVTGATLILGAGATVTNDLAQLYERLSRLEKQVGRTQSHDDDKLIHEHDALEGDA